MPNKSVERTPGKRRRSRMALGSMMHDREQSAIELHDSEIETIAAQPRGVAVQFAHAYVHRSQGKPGVDPGTGWSQRAALVLVDGAIAGQHPKLPAFVADGALSTAAATYENTIPIPFEYSGSTQLTLKFATGETLTISGSGAVLKLLGSPRYVEKFPGS